MVDSIGAGRYAPSPSGDLHIGNLRTALLAWLFARSSGRHFRLRFEDLDRTADGAAERQRDDLAAIGLDWDPPEMRQSSRLDVYAGVVTELMSVGRTFECFCTRREILEAPSAPHSPPGAYPGTCRHLTEAERAARRASGRRPAIRLLSDTDTFTVTDELHGAQTGTVDDFVLVRGDGTYAYNLVVVVDDGAQGVDQVVRGDDLLSSAPRQAYLATLLGIRPPVYAHVPMVLNTDHIRLAKRDGAVTLSDLHAAGMTTAQVVSLMAESLGLASPGEPVSAQALLQRFSPQRLPREPWIFEPPQLVED